MQTGWNAGLKTGGAYFSFQAIKLISTNASIGIPTQDRERNNPQEF
jgi:hypothetical protein